MTMICSFLPMLVFVLTVYAEEPKFKSCWDYTAVTISLAKLNGTWFVQKYTAPNDQLRTKCETHTYVMKPDGKTGSIINTFTYDNFPIPLTAIANMKEGDKPGTFQYHVTNFPSDVVSHSSLLVFGEGGFVSCLSAANGSRPSTFVVATRTKDVDKNKLEDLVKQGVDKGMDKAELLDVSQEDCH